MRALFTFFFCFGITSVLFGQHLQRSSLNAFGHVVRKGGVVLSQTVGQSSVYKVTQTQSKTILHQGFQQPLNQSVRTTQNTLKFRLYPNPNNGDFTILFPDRKKFSFKYCLVDNLGRIIISGNKKTNGQSAFLFKLSTGSYTLKLEDETGKIGFKKIIVVNKL